MPCVTTSSMGNLGSMSLGHETVVVFDVNETLLDLRALAPVFESVLPREMMSLWFSQMLRNSLVATATATYEPFDRQGVAALISTGASVGTEISVAEAEAVVAGMTRLPPHPDVVGGLGLLSDAGLRLATLTNSSAKMLRQQIGNAGLDQYFEELISVEEVLAFKPDPRTYSHAANRLGVDISRLCLVAAHDWDVTGAIRAGANAAFLRRGGSTIGLLSESPEIVGDDLVGVAESIVRDFHPRA